MRSLDDLLGEGVSGRRVLVRTDLNVPLDKTTSEITDDGRIRASLPTLQSLREAGARVIVAAHLGRPKGAPDPQFSLSPVAARLGELLGTTVPLAADVAGDDARAKADALERDARQRHQEAISGLDAKRNALQKHIEELKQFEREYRTRLKAYLESQLRDLDGRAQGIDAELQRTEAAGRPGTTGGLAAAGLAGSYSGRDGGR